MTESAEISTPAATTAHSHRKWYYIGGAVAVVLLLLYLRSRAAAAQNANANQASSFIPANFGAPLTPSGVSMDTGSSMPLPQLPQSNQIDWATLLPALLGLNNPNATPAPTPAPSGTPSNSVTPVSDSQISDWFSSHPGATDIQIAGAMDQYNVTPGQVASNRGMNLADVAGRYATAETAMHSYIAPAPTAAPVSNSQPPAFNVPPPGNGPAPAPKPAPYVAPSGYGNPGVNQGPWT